MYKRSKKLNVIVGCIVVITIIVIIFVIPSPRLRKKQSVPDPVEMEVAVEFEEETHSKSIAPLKHNKVAESNVSTSESSGAFPPIRANYRKHLGFKKYAECMTKLGVCFIIPSYSKKIFHRIDFVENEIIKISLKQLQQMKFSPRTRVINDEPYLTAFLNKRGVENKEVLLLVPAKIEQHIAEVTFNYFKRVRRGIEWGKVSSLEGYYTIVGGKICLNISEAIANNISYPVNIKILLN